MDDRLAALLDDALRPYLALLRSPDDQNDKIIRGVAARLTAAGVTVNDPDADHFPGCPGCEHCACAGVTRKPSAAQPDGLDVSRKHGWRDRDGHPEWFHDDWHCLCGWYGNGLWQGYARHLEAMLAREYGAAQPAEPWGVKWCKCDRLDHTHYPSECAQPAPDALRGPSDIDDALARCGVYWGEDPMAAPDSERRYCWMGSDGADGVWAIDDEITIALIQMFVGFAAKTVAAANAQQMPAPDGPALFDAAVQRAFAGSGVEVRPSFTPQDDPDEKFATDLAYARGFKAGHEAAQPAPDLRAAAQAVVEAQEAVMDPQPQPDWEDRLDRLHNSIAALRDELEKA